MPPVTSLEIVKETPTTVADAHDGMGMVASYHVTTALLDTVDEHPSCLAWPDRKDNKGVPVGDSVQREFIGLRDKLKLDYRAPFE